MSKIAVIVVVAMMSLATNVPVVADEKNAIPIVRDFFEKYINLEEPNLHEYSLEEQYEIFIYGNTCIHPPNMELTVEFAKQGVDVIDMLKKKLNETDDVSTIVNIIRVFSFMTALKSYEVVDDEELMTFLQDTVNRMEDGFWKRNSQSNLDDIASGQLR